MYAVFVSGGKQHRVKVGDVLKLEKLVVSVGESIDFDQVLMIVSDDKTALGSPLITGAMVSTTVVAQGRSKKVEIIKFRRRKHHMKRMGHRQWFTQVKVTGINQ